MEAHKTNPAENSQSENKFSLNAARDNMSIFCPLAPNMMLIKRVKVRVREGARISSMDRV